MNNLNTPLQPVKDSPRNYPDCNEVCRCVFCKNLFYGITGCSIMCYVCLNNNEPLGIVDNPDAPVREFKTGFKYKK